MSKHYRDRKQMKKRISSLLSDFKSKWSEYPWVKHISMIPTHLSERSFEGYFTYKGHKIQRIFHFPLSERIVPTPSIDGELTPLGFEKLVPEFKLIDKRLVVGLMLRVHGKKK